MRLTKKRDLGRMINAFDRQAKGMSIVLGKKEGGKRGERFVSPFI